MRMRILSGCDIKKSLNMKAVMETVESVYKLKAQDQTVVWPTIVHDFITGQKDMDIKSGYIKGEEVHGLKILNWTAANAEKGLPTLVGLIMVFDSVTGLPLGVVDGSVITGMRTGCAGAIGAKYLARKDSRKLFVLGAGNQAIYQIAAFITCFPEMKKIYVADPVNPENAENFVQNIKRRLADELKIDASGIEFATASKEEDMAKGVADSDMIVTVTPARAPVIRKEWIRPGTHLSCIGSDMSGKEEIDAEIFKDAVIYLDDYNHVVEVGEVEIPLKTGVISESDIKGEIGKLILGETEGRISDDQITVYDACGIALLDIATAKSALEMAENEGFGQIAEI